MTLKAKKNWINERKCPYLNGHQLLLLASNPSIDIDANSKVSRFSTDSARIKYYEMYTIQVDDRI